MLIYNATITIQTIMIIIMVVVLLLMISVLERVYFRLFKNPKTDRLAFSRLEFLNKRKAGRRVYDKISSCIHKKHTRK
jgi:hypothetical protein